MKSEVGRRKTEVDVPRDANRFQPESRDEWRAWLEENGSTTSEVWLVLWKAHTGRRLDFQGLVEEALCFGWIDSRAEKLDTDRSMVRFTPRQQGSGWSRINKERVERLGRDGLMTDSGWAVVDAAKDDGSWALLDDVEALVVPADLEDALASRPGARERWEAFPPSARKAMLGWIAQAKREITRTARVTETAERAATGERADRVDRSQST
jgi:uncharacterized protein YdeI (YjbR/CyaY-like superfamily)